MPPPLGATGKGEPNAVDIWNACSLHHRGGGDPFLSGEVAFETITGIQSEGVQACAKHYINK